MMTNIVNFQLALELISQWAIPATILLIIVWAAVKRVPMYESFVTGAKEGCNNGNCGACTVLWQGNPVDSCLVLAIECEGASIETVESLACDTRLHPLQQCFLEGAALQCGVCTPGFLMAAKALLDHDNDPSEQDIRFQLAGNLCRCTGYDKIVRALQEAARLMRK